MTKPSRTAPKAPPAPALPASGGSYIRDANGALAPAPQPDAPDQKDPEA